MEPKNYGSSGEQKAERNYRVLTIIWFALLSAVTIFLFLTFIIRRGATEENLAIFAILAALSLSTFVFSFILKRMLTARAASDHRPELVMQGHIMALALSESSGVLGLVSYVLTGTNYHYLLFALAYLGMLLHKPDRDSLLAASTFKKI